MSAELLKVVSEMTRSHVLNYVTPGLTSSLVGGDGRGCVRLFTSDRETREWIVPHSHRFDFACLVLKGEVENILFEPSGLGDRYAEGTVRAIAGGMGMYDTTRSGKWFNYEERAARYVAGDVYSMTHEQIHSIRFSRDARVLFFEGPNVCEESVFLEPFSNGKVIRTFETRPWMFEREESADA